jgi:hypothetical protein
MANPYSDEQPVYISDPSNRLNMPRFTFPYTPTITTISSTGYSSYDVTHSNFQQRAFDMASNVELSIAAPYVVENDEQGEYLMKAMLFFRGAMKMNFGLNDESRGLPPPILRFNAYGVYENVPVVVRDFTHNLDADVDYVELSSGGRVPVISNIVLSLTTTYAPKSVRNQFTLNDYVNGNLKDKGYV